jgi:hypothetical protein
MVLDKLSFSYTSNNNPNGMSVTVYPTAAKARTASYLPGTDYPFPSADRIGNVIVRFGDVLIGKQFPTDADLRACLKAH